MVGSLKLGELTRDAQDDLVGRDVVLGAEDLSKGGVGGGKGHDETLGERGIGELIARGSKSSAGGLHFADDLIGIGSGRDG